MHFAAPLMMLTRWWRRPAPRRHRPQEPADLGTAFGMEQWLDEADTLPAPLPGPPRARRRWWPRWTARATLN